MNNHQIGLNEHAMKRVDKFLELYAGMAATQVVIAQALKQIGDRLPVPVTSPSPAPRESWNDAIAALKRQSQSLKMPVVESEQAIYYEGFTDAIRVLEG